MLQPPLEFVSLPAALRVRLPRQAAGVSPSAAAVTFSERACARFFRSQRGTGKPPRLSRTSTSELNGRRVSSAAATADRANDEPSSQAQEPQ